MKIGIINIEPSIYNTAYMQIANYYRGTGHIVEWCMPDKHKQFDHVFCSSIFDYTDKSGIPEGVICGGTGFDISSRLSQVIENSDLDYSIYPSCETSYLWFSRGCNRNCPWCVVQKKEGRIHPVQVKNLNPVGSSVTVCDNSFFENPEWEKAIKYLREINLPCDIQQGVDVRTITKRQAFLLSKLRRQKDKRIKFAWDNPFDEAKVIDGINRMLQFIRPHDLMCYVLVGFLSSQEQDLYRINLLRRFKISPFVMPYRQRFYQKTLARWVNHKAIFNTVSWKKYFEQQKEKRLGRNHFECS